jgi:biopolymer transport protein ExbD
MAGSADNENAEVGFQIAPMVDVVFVLMLFFMASVGLQVTEKELPIKLPSLPSGDVTPPPVGLIMINVGADGQVQMNNVAYGTPADRNLESLRAKLKGLIDSFGDDPVIIHPVADARHERVVDVLNAAAASGVKNLTFD